MTRKNGMTAVTVANQADQALSLARAVEHYRGRMGEPGVDAEFLARTEEALAKAQFEALQDASKVEGSLLIGADGHMEVLNAVGKGRRSQARGPVTMKDAHYRLTALILGNPTQDPTKTYAGLDAYDGKSRQADVAREAGRVKVSEKTEGTFVEMRLWSADEWADLEARLEARMTGREVALVASEGCSGCRRSKAYSEARGLAVKPCRPCGKAA